MKLPRRTFLQLAAGAVALPAASRFARAQAYPARPVRLVVGFAPGGTTDLGARLMGQWLSERLGQQFVIENRTGAATNIATEAVVRSPADGYTLLVVTASNAINATLYDKLGFDFLRDIAPVAGSNRVTLVMEVHPSFPAQTIPEFIAYAKANPGKINMGSGGKGSTGAMCGELFQMMAGVKFQHVPYRGESLAMADLIGGQVQMVVATVGSSIQYIKAGQVRALAVTSETRTDALPDVPPIADALPGYEATSWSGLMAPKGTPREIVDKLNREINAGLADLKIKARLVDMGGTALAGPPAEFGKLIADETEKWGRVVKFSGAKPE
jgi:tripartite-type tricarboxylate transporter receptor subunit TctC